jgi:hypothetical protein
MKEKENELWISPIDKHGDPVDATLIETARQAWPVVIAISRQRRVYDVGWLRETMENIVHATSRRIRKDRHITINTGYFVTSCKNEMKRYATEEADVDLRPFEELDSPIDSSWEERLHRDLIIDELLARIDQKHIDLVLLRLKGEHWKFIARTLGISVGSARVQYCKTLKLLREIANNQDSRPKSKQKSQNA